MWSRLGFDRCAIGILPNLACAGHEHASKAALRSERLQAMSGTRCNAEFRTTHKSVMWSSTQAHVPEAAEQLEGVHCSLRRTLSLTEVFWDEHRAKGRQSPIVCLE